MTMQESLFFDRVALKLEATPALTIEEAAQLVCNDDMRILNRYVHLRDDEREALHAGMCSLIYDRLTSNGKEA